MCLESGERRAESGFTIIELTLASAIVASLVLALAVMSDAVYRGGEHSQGYGLAVQHARVVIDRINRHVREAVANKNFPGARAASEKVNGYEFPDALVVWSPKKGETAADPEGWPLVRELVVYAPNPDAPNELLEITDREDSTPTNAQTAWRDLVDSMIARASGKKTLLTDLLRTAQVREGDPSSARAALRFIPRLTPSAQGGLQQSWVRYEMQLLPGREIGANNAGAMPARPFFGSAAGDYPSED
jgi:Tfp pilus assembly protein PilW